MTVKDETAALSRAPLTQGPDAVSARLSTLAPAPRWLAAGGILAAIGAASCCVIPFALFTLGVSGAWIGNLTALEPYQPIFALVSFGFIGWGAYRVYSKPKDVCVPGSYCADPRSDRLAKIGLWSAGAMVIVAVTFPYVARAYLS